MLVKDGEGAKKGHPYLRQGRGNGQGCGACGAGSGEIPSVVKTAIYGGVPAGAEAVSMPPAIPARVSIPGKWGLCYGIERFPTMAAPVNDDKEEETCRAPAAIRCGCENCLGRGRGEYTLKASDLGHEYVNPEFRLPILNVFHNLAYAGNRKMTKRKTLLAIFNFLPGLKTFCAPQTARRPCKRQPSEAARLGYEAEILTDCLSGEARKMAVELCNTALERQNPWPAISFCLLAGGETTVTIKGDGRGGRNQEMAWPQIFALRKQGEFAPSLLARMAADGPTDAAGGIRLAHGVEKMGADKRGKFPGRKTTATRRLPSGRIACKLGPTRKCHGHGHIAGRGPRGI